MLQVRNWDKFQHYKDRCPPWIKLSTDTFQNPDFACLHGASKLLAIAVWTLASKKDGLVPDSLAYITQWGFLADQVEQRNLEELVNKGFLVRVASNKLARRKQTARERRGEERRGEKIKPPIAPLPDWIPIENWNAFVEMRKRIHAPLTAHAKDLIIAKLNSLRATENPAAVLDQSTMNSWRGVFPIHESGNGNRKSFRAADAEVGKWDGTISKTSECYRCRRTFNLSEAVEEIFCSQQCADYVPKQAS